MKDHLYLIYPFVQEVSVLLVHDRHGQAQNSREEREADHRQEHQSHSFLGVAAPWPTFAEAGGAPEECEDDEGEWGEEDAAHDVDDVVYPVKRHVDGRVGFEDEVVGEVEVEDALLVTDHCGSESLGEVQEGWRH